MFFNSKENKRAIELAVEARESASRAANMAIEAIESVRIHEEKCFEMNSDNNARLVILDTIILRVEGKIDDVSSNIINQNAGQRNRIINWLLSLAGRCC